MATQIDTIGYSISSSNCVSDTTKTDYPYAVSIDVNGVTANDKVCVVMAGSDCENFSKDCESSANSIKFYAKNNTFGTAKISTIIVDKEEQAVTQEVI